MSFCAQVSQSEQERRASALGYVTQAVLQLAAVLDVPLRYPVAPGASRSYICDLQPTWAGGSSRTERVPGEIIFIPVWAISMTDVVFFH